MKLTPRLAVLYAFLGVLTILFFVGGPGYYSPRSFHAFWNLGHILYYALLCIAISTVTRRRQLSVRFQIVIVLAVTLVLGIVVEVLQIPFNRSFDVGDLARNLIGAAVGIAFFLPGRKTIRKGALRLLQVVSMVLVATQIYPVATALTNEVRARSQFPVLADFEDPSEIQRWGGYAVRSIEGSIAFSGRHAMRVSLNTMLYSGVSLDYFPGDWTGYSQFQCSIYNPIETPIAITCRIYDLAHVQGVQRFADRYNRTFLLNQGWNTISVDLADVRNAPADRSMDMGRIRGVGIFATRLPRPRDVYIDRVVLVR